MKLKIEKSTYWFVYTFISNLLYSPVVWLFLKNQNIGERFKGLNMDFYVSEIYISIGIIWLIFSVIYMLADNSKYFKFTEKSKRLHFFSTLPCIICIMAVPILETFFPLTDTNRGGWFIEVFTYTAIFSTFAFFGGMIVYFVNLVRALINLILRKSI